MDHTIAPKDVLVVDDEQDITDIISYSLTNMGFTVREAITGPMALKEVAMKLPDLVVLDRMLPGIDGIEVCRLIRNNAETALLPIVMLTAKGSDKDVIAGLEAGADDYVTKPFHPLVLVERIRTILRRTSRSTRSQESAGTEGVSSRAIPVCSYCRSIRDGDNHWHSMESYFDKWHRVYFTHGICPDCSRKEMASMLNIPSDA
ncbi:MAG: response regulator [bacterium]